MKALTSILFSLLMSFILATCGSGQLFGAPTITAGPPAGPTFPLASGTPLPGNLLAISPDNADQLIQLARWGKGKINQLAWAPGGKWFAVASSLGIYVYDAATLEEVRFIETDASIPKIAFSPNAKTLASGSADGKIQLWRFADGKLLHTLTEHTDSA